MNSTGRRHPRSAPQEGEDRRGPGGVDAPSPDPPTVRALSWIAWIGGSALLTELFLIRIFDAIVGPSAAYALVGLALFGISLAGVVVALRPSWGALSPRRITLALGATPVFLWVVLRYVPFSVARIADEPVLQAVSFLILGVALLLPFFLSALAVVGLLSRGTVRTVYAADLAGSALGPWLLPLLLPLAGPAGVLLTVAGGHVLAANLLAPADGRPAQPAQPHERLTPAASSAPSAAPSTAPRASRVGRHALPLVGVVFLVVALSGRLASWDLPNHAEKRGAEETERRTHAEFRRWDPVSKIEVVDLTERDPKTGEVLPGTGRKLISYDGGAQSSHIYAFDGDYETLRATLPDHVLDHFWQRGVLAAPWFFRDQGARIFVAGCAGGQEVTGGLLFGAKEILAVDLVPTVIELGTERYADYNGGIFLDPRVQYRQAEARTELARSSGDFDVIQIFSYHNSSRVAAGSLALKAFYLQTAETYQLCMESLSPNGILQIHQAFFPRVVATLAKAWSELGGTDLERHVLVYGRDEVEDHYTILFKRSPWTEEEVRDVDSFLLADFPSEDWNYVRIESPVDRAGSFLPDEIYDAPLSPSLRDRAAYRITPVTDDDPFSHWLRKGWGRIAPTRDGFATESEAVLLNQVIPNHVPLPRDIAHLVVLTVAGVFVSLIAFAVAAFAGRRTIAPSARADHASDLPAPAPRHGSAFARNAYFYLVGLAFIGVEWTLVQFAMRLVAEPIPAFGAALAVVLVGSALGSLASSRLSARVVFPALLLIGTLLFTFYPAVFPSLWDDPIGVRLVVFVLAALPLSFCLGFPFPSGLVLLGDTREVAAAWALNGAASVTGSVLVAWLFASIGMAATGGIALAAYGLAGVAFARMSRHAEADR
ncbi:MAG: hypothetical protein H6682_04060 [Candidatus Eisenbacteria bacterium]|nr:hypothetical protein [Candidatus Eisenbacteria bacterium]